MRPDAYKMVWDQVHGRVNRRALEVVWRKVRASSQPVVWELLWLRARQRVIVEWLDQVAKVLKESI